MTTPIDNVFRAHCFSLPISVTSDPSARDKMAKITDVYVRHQQTSSTYPVSIKTEYKTSDPNVIWEDRVALTKLRNKVPIGYNGTPHIHPETASSLR